MIQVDTFQIGGRRAEHSRPGSITVACPVRQGSPRVPSPPWPALLGFISTLLVWAGRLGAPTSQPGNCAWVSQRKRPTRGAPTGLRDNGGRKGREDSMPDKLPARETSQTHQQVNRPEVTGCAGNTSLRSLSSATTSYHWDETTGQPAELIRQPDKYRNRS